ncbi:hypothetical protein, partial [Halalkalibacter alkalisediminis]|uniref:hypothetical protein n=1 Tax=Halalkalibacter alkalisediminis TaxID=935616 RepID=UPI00235EB5F1
FLCLETINYSKLLDKFEETLCKANDDNSKKYGWSTNHFTNAEFVQKGKVRPFCLIDLFSF